MARSFFVTKPVLSLSLDTASTNILDSAFTEVTPALEQPSSGVEIYNGTGKVIEIARGGAGSEVLIPYRIAPKDSSPVLPIEFSKSDRFSVRCLSGEGTADLGMLVFNFFG